MDVKALQPLKEVSPMVVNDAGSVRDDKKVQLRNAFFPIEVTVEGKVHEVRVVLPMLVVVL